jgi:DNA-binding Lrp family transcriptional regulator
LAEGGWRSGLKLKETVAQGGYNMTLDALDLNIVEVLRATPRASNRMIAESVGASEMTVGTRVRRLVDSGDIAIIGRSDLAMLGFGLIAHVDIHVAPGKIASVAACLAQSDQISVVDVVAGAAPVMVVFQARSEEDILRVIETDIAPVEGVERVELTVAVETVKLVSGHKVS